MFGRIIGLDPNIFSAIGMVSLLAGVANTPISASLMAVELFGAQVAPYAAIACVISFLMTGHRSVYPSQVLSIAKAASFIVDKGGVMEDIDAIEVKLRPKSLIGGIVKLINRMRGK